MQCAYVSRGAGSGVEKNLSQVNSASGRRYWLDIARIAAIFSVMLLHMSAWTIYSHPVATKDWMICVSFDSISRFCVPLLIMVSGALWLDPKRDIESSYLFRHVLRLVTALIAWNLIYALFYTARNYFASGEIVFDPQALSGGRYTLLGNYHLIFLYALIGLYLVVPLLRRVVTSKRTMEYLLILAFLVSGAFPLFSQNQWISEHVMPFLVAPSPSFVAGYIGYFVLGFYLANVKLPKWFEYALYAAGICGLAGTIVGVTIQSSQADALSEQFFTYTMLNIGCYTAAAFYFIKRVALGVKVSNLVGKALRLISCCCFGAYLCHDLIILCLTQIGVTPALFPLWISIPAFAVVIFIFSLMVSYVLNKIPVVKVYLV